MMELVRSCQAGCLQEVSGLLLQGNFSSYLTSTILLSFVISFGKLLSTSFNFWVFFQIPFSCKVRFILYFQYKYVAANKAHIFLVKRTVARDFRPSVLFINQPQLGPDTRAKALWYMASYSPR
jgi:hypothetical protein